MDQKTEKDTEVKSWAKGIFAITLFEEDLAAAKQFYLKVFGLGLVFEDENSVVFKIGETLINLLKSSEADDLVKPAKAANREAGSRLVFTVHVEDVDALCAAISAQGVTLLNGPLDRPWGVRTASFVDPGGHIWEIAK